MLWMLRACIRPLRGRVRLLQLGGALGSWQQNNAKTIKNLKDNTYNWSPPPSGLKLNIDGSFNQSNNKRDTGCVIRDSKYNWITGKSTKISVVSVAYIELSALIHGLKLAQAQNVMDIVITTDSTEVIKMLANCNDTDLNILIECRELLRQMKKSMIQYEPREGNRVADLLARHGRNPFFFWKLLTRTRRCLHQLSKNLYYVI